MKTNFLFFDIDGTLMSHKTNCIPESTKQSIQQAQKNGCKVFIASGRPYFEIKMDYGFEPDGYLFSSGAGFEANDKVILNRTFNPRLLKDIIQKGEECGVGIHLLGSDKGYCNDIQKNFFTSMLEKAPREIRKAMTTSDFFQKGHYPLHEYEGQDIHKLNALFVEGCKKQEFLDYVSDITTVVLFNSQDLDHDSAEISPIDVNKGTGVLMVVTHYHGDMNNSFAFGDSMNDYEMIKEVNHGVVMGNGQQELKDIAEFVTTDIDDDGIMNALKHYNLI